MTIVSNTQHQSIDSLVHHGGNGVNAPSTLLERRVLQLLFLIRSSQVSPASANDCTAVFLPGIAANFAGLDIIGWTI